MREGEGVKAEREVALYEPNRDNRRKTRQKRN